MNLTLRKMECVIALADARNYARAAEQLGVSQPALSRTIAQLEERYGVRLFERGKGGIALTGPGEALLADAQRVLALARLADHNLREQAVGEGGLVRMGMGPLPAGLLLKRVLARTVRERPRLTVSCTVDSAERLLLRLAAGEIDFCVFSENLMPGGNIHSVRPIGRVRLGLFVRAGHPLAGRSPVGQAELAAFPIASGNSAMGEDFGQFSATIASDDFDALKGLMLETDTVLLGGHGLVAGELSRREVVELELADRWRHEPASLVLVRTAGRSQSRAVRDMMERVVAEMAPLREVASGDAQDASSWADPLLGAAPQ